MSPSAPLSTAWDSVVARLREAERRERELAEQARQFRAARQELDTWSQGAVQEVLAAVKDACVSRAGALASFEVEYPAKPPSSLGHHAGPCASFLRLALGPSQIYLYSLRGPGELPYLHFVALRVTPPRARPERLVSLPGCFIARRPQGTLQLRAIHIRGQTPRVVELTPEDLALRALQLLAAKLETTLRARGAIESPPPLARQNVTSIQAAPP